MRSEIRRVAILAPMPSELRPVVATMGLRRRGRDPVHEGRVGVVDVIAMRTGMGVDLATAATHRLFDAESVDHVVVVGIAGGVGAVRVGELVCPTEVVDAATNRRYSAHPFTDAAGGTISSSDDFVVDPERIATLIASGVRALDMETAAVAAVCGDHQCEWSAVRVVSDLTSDHPDAAVLGLAHPDGSPNVRAALRFMVGHPARIPQLLRLGRDASRAARSAAVEVTRQLAALGAS